MYQLTKEWQVIQVDDIDKSSYKARYELKQLGIKPNVRYCFCSRKGNYLSRMFCLGTPSEKVQDAKTARQFELSIEQENIINQKLADYLNEEKIERYYRLASITEYFARFKPVGATKLARIYGVDKMVIYQDLKILCERKLLAKTQKAYVATFSEEKWNEQNVEKTVVPKDKQTENLIRLKNRINEVLAEHIQYTDELRKTIIEQQKTIEEQRKIIESLLG